MGVRVRLPVGVSDCRSRISEISCRNFIKFLTHAICRRGSVFFWRRCDTLSTSGFVDEVMFVCCTGKGGENRASTQSNSPGAVPQRSFSCEIIDGDTHTHIVPIALSGPVKWSVTNLSHYFPDDLYRPRPCRVVVDSSG